MSIGKHIVTAALAFALLAAPAVAARAALEVVATIPELAAIAREVGGAKVRVTSIAQPNQDYHRVEARPSDVARLSKADLFVRVGMDFDQWADALLGAARNKRVSPGGPGYVDASARIKRLEVPTERISGASGDIHAQGNPHYYYDPGCGKVIAHNILLGLRRVSPGDAATFDANYQRFVAAIDAAMPRWQRAMAACKGTPVVTYHKNWVYFMNRFGVREFATLEPKPGIPPSPAYLRRLIDSMKREKVKAMVVETIYPKRFPEFVARETGARLEWAPYSIGVLGTQDYLSFVDRIVQAFQRACQ
ncbi:MAG: zinc ABC transporter substrate-binding protein [Armatimonadetes bacterium]|jgi:zinc/manganese transport system substrate-binding protein|nr:zinc ABC transporter substrate-binding protein [Armatimonadota bacterium]